MLSEAVLPLAVMDRLHRIVSWESPSAMSEAAAAGEACVWCAGPLGEAPARLQTGAPRLACGQCYSARLAWYVTWYDWHRHVTGCISCRQARDCHVGRGFRALHDVTIVFTPAGKTGPRCVSCHHPVHEGELAVPVLWEGNSCDHLGYAHPQCLMTRGTSR